MEMSGQFYAPVNLLPGEIPPYPLDRRLSGPQSRSGRFGEVKTHGFIWNETPAVQPAARRYAGLTKRKRLFI
jgi:hypothetical protein